MTITAKVQKTKGGKIGLKLTSENGKLYVTKIAEGGAIDNAKTGLTVGMEVIAINGEDARGMASTAAAKMMLDTEGTLRIEARHPQGAFVCGTFTKDTPTTKVGLRLEDGGDRVMINSIREGTLAASTELGGGMAIRLINNTDCVGKDAMFVAQLLADAVGSMTVVAETPDAGELADRELVSAAVVKEEGAKLGLTLTEVEDKLVVTKIKEGGLVAGTDLKVGMEIYSINNISVAGKSSTEAAGLLIEAKGTLTILAFKGDIDGDEEGGKAKSAAGAAVAASAGAAGAAAGREIVTVTVEKKPGAKLGLTLSEVDGKLVVTKVKEGGLVAGTRLSQGMEMFSINGIEVTGKSSTEAAGILVDASGTLTIIAFAAADGDEGGDKATAMAGAAAAAAALGREVVTVQVQKQEGAKLGLTLSEVDDKLVVTKVKEGGLIAGTELATGMEIFSINGAEVTGKSSSEAAGILVNAKGTITIIAFKGEIAGDNQGEKSAKAAAATPSDAAVAAAAGRQIVTVQVEKQEGAKLGLTLSEVDDKLVVTKVKEGGLVAGTELATGMEIFSINGAEVAGKSSTEAAGMLVNAKGTITIIAFKGEIAGDKEGEKSAKAASAAGPSDAAAAAAAGRQIVTVQVEKQEGAKLGLTLSEVDDKLVVTKIKEGGLVAGTELATGMEIFSINGAEVAGKSSSEAAGILVNAKGIISITAFKGEVAGVNREAEKSDALAKAAVGAAAVGAAAGTAAAVSTSASTAAAASEAEVSGFDAEAAAAAAAAAAGGKEVVTVQVEKQEGAKLGLTLSEVEDKLVVTKVKEGGLVAGTDLTTGMEIFSINGTEVAGKSSSEAAGMLVEAKGTITIIAFKGEDEGDDKSGLAKAAVGAAAATAAVAGAAAATAAAVGTKETTEVAAGEAAEAVTGAEDAVAAAEVSAFDPEAAAAAATAAAGGKEVVTVQVEKQEGAKLGLTLSEVEDKLVVTKVKEGGLVAGTDLTTGMEIFSINGTEVAGKSSSEAAGMLVEAKGMITIIAFKGEVVEEKSSTLAKAAVGAAAVGAAAGAAAAVSSAADDSGDAAAAAAAASEAAGGREVITVQVEKQEGAKLGLTLSEVDDKLVVTKVKEGGLVAGTELSPGMEIFSINGIGVAGKSSAEAAGILVDAKGTLTIIAFKGDVAGDKGGNLAKGAVGAVAGTAMAAAAAGREVVTVQVQKQEGAKLGLTLSEMEDKLVVTKVKEGGLVAATELAPGMEIFSINGTEVAGKSSSEAAGMLVEAKGTITIVAFRGDIPAVASTGGPVDAAAGREVVTVQVEKQEGAKLGLTLSEMEDRLVVTKVKEGGLVAGTELTPGMEIFSINGTEVAGKSSSEAAGILVDAKGTLTIVAFRGKIEEESSLPKAVVGAAAGAAAAAAAGREIITVQVTKQEGAKLGLTLSEMENKLVVTKVKEGGLVADTELGPGMEIFSINGIEVAGKSSSEAAGILVEAKGTLTITAFKGTVVGSDDALLAAAAGREVVTVKVKKEVGAKLGLTLADMDGKLIVTKVKEGGLVAGTELGPGMEIYTINGIEVAGKSSSEAAGILVEAKGTITIVAFKGELKSNNLAKAAVGAAAVAAGAGTAAAVASAAKSGTDDAAASQEGGRKPGLAVATGAAAAAGAIPRSPSLKTTVPPGTYTMAVIKKEPGQKIGFRLGLLNETVVVSGIGEGSLAAKTDIQAGMVFISINNKSCAGMDTTEIAKCLAEAGDTIVIVAQTPGPSPASKSLIAAVVNKDPDAKVGVTLTRQGGKLVITKLKEDGLLANTDLRVGMEVLSIDNVNCVGKTSPEAAQLFKQVDGTLMILAQKPALAAGALVTAALSRDSPDSKLGIRLGMTNGVVVVTNISDGSLASMTDMEPGMAVRTINNTDVAGMESTDAANLLKDAEGIITILAETREKGSSSGADIKSLVAASVLNTNGANLGLTLSQVDGKLVISKIDAEGLFFGTPLRVGMQVLKINNVDCSILTQEASELLMQKQGTLTVLAKRGAILVGSLLTAVLYKETADTKVGLGLGVSNGLIVITKIKDGTLGAMTDLRPGVVIRTVNNQSCQGKDSMGVAKLLSEAVGTVTIVAEAVEGSAGKPGKVPKYFTATINKESGDKVGLALTQKGGALVVTKIAEGGLVEGSGLEVGMEVVTINNVDCSKKTNAEAAELLQQGEGTMTILAKKPPLAPGALVTASFTKDSPETKVGLKLGKQNDIIVVAGIGEDSLAAGTDLEPGMVVKSINNNDCTGLDITQAASLLIEPEGILTILAEVPKGRVGGAGAAVISSLVTATALKEKDEPAGVKVERSSGKLLVSEIIQEGALFGTGLRLGMEIVSINNVDAGVLTTVSGNELLKKEGAITILAKPVSLPPGTLLTAAFTKETPDTKVGIGLGLSNGVIVISKVRDGTVAATTNLATGMVVRAINNVDCTRRSPEMAAKILKEAVGTVTILAEKPTNSGVDMALPVSNLFAVTFTKEKDGKVGVSLNNEAGKLNVGSISENSIVANTRLREGMEVVKINNIDCVGMAPSEAAALLAQSEGSITILAKKKSSPPGTMITVVMTKDSPDAKVGVGLGNVKGAVVVTNIKDDTLAASTDLEVGMIVRTINNVDCGDIDVVEAAKLLKESEGKVTLVAEAPSAKYEPCYDSLITATVDKDKDEKVGVTVASKGDKVFISKIKSDGLIAGTDLAVGMELISVNNTVCAGKPSAETAKLLAESQGTLTLLAKKSALPPGSFVTAIITKDSPDTKVGLRLGIAGGLVVVSSLAEDSLASETELKGGMVIRTINNVDCTGMQPPDVAKLLMEAEGTVSILAETPSAPGVAADAPALSSFVTVSVHSAAGSDVGLSLHRSEGKLLVSEIKEGGAVVGSALRVGMEVVKINNVDCGVLTADAATLLLTSEETFTILARKPELAPGSLVTAVVKKESEDTKVGLRMGFSHGMVVVTGVADGSLASTTPLESGMVVRSINNQDLARKTSMDAAKMLSAASGLITILAEVPSKTAVSAMVPSLVTASIDKNGDADNGVTFAEDEGGKVVVASISKDGKWATTRLRAGMHVKMINTFSCDGRSPSELDAIIENSEGKVTILAEVKALPPGTLVTAVVTKESPDVKVGLGIGEIAGKVYITSIRNDTLASPTDLRSGMQLRLINNIDCAELGAAEVGKLLSEGEGNLTIVAAVPGSVGAGQPGEATPITATVVKEQDVKVGLALTDKGGKVYISKIYEDGLMAGTALRVGMQIMSIDNVQCEGKKAADCGILLKEAEGNLTVLASNPVLPPGSFVTAVITKGSQGTKVGLRLGQEKGKIIITGTAEGSLASETDLKPGMTLRAIDNIDCSGLSTTDVAKLLMDSEGTLTILAATPEKTRWSPDSESMENICAVSFKKDSDSELGMTLSRKGGYLVVTEILEEGLIYGTALRVGMEILKINNTDCSVLTAESGKVLMEKEGMVTILARKKDLPPGFLVTAVIVKGSPDTKVGLGMGSKNGLIYVTKIRDGTVAARTDLRPGLIVRTIDNIDLAGMSLVDAANLLANAEGTITVAGEMPSEDMAEKGPGLVVANVKTTKDEKVGLALAQKGGKLYVSQIHKRGVFRGTALGVGMRVLSVNNITCQEMSVQDAATMMMGTEGDLTILAQKAEVQPGGLVTASITKQNVASKIGLRLAATKGGLIVVKGITAGSLAAKTELKPGMVVKSIDNVDVTGKDAVSAAKLLTDAQGIITVVAESPSEDPRGTPASTLVTLTVNVDDGSKAGLEIKKKNGRTFVSKIETDGPLFGSGLRVGMELLKINNVDCVVLTGTSAKALVEEGGMVTILARKTLKRAGILVAASFKKPTANTKAGIGMGNSKGRIIITKTGDGTLASTTEIQKGMVVRQINNVSVGGMEATDAAKLIGGAVGVVTLLLETPSASDNVATESLIKSLAVAAVDMDEEGDLGFSLYNKNGALNVSKVSRDGRLANSGLRPGMTLLSINNTNCGRKSAANAMSTIAETSGMVTLLTQKPFLGPGEIVTANMNRADKSQPIGLGLGSSSKTGKVVITSIKPGTMSHFTDLYPGMSVKSINNQSMKGKTPEDAARALSQSTGTITVAVESMLDFDPDLVKGKGMTKPSTITATVTKEKGGKVGLLLGEKGSKLFVSKIVPGGLMSETDLKVGMQVLSVNNVECMNLPVAEAARILMEAEGNVTILAKQPELSPGALITVSVVKETAESPVGIGLGVLNNKVVISSIKYGSLASHTDLQVGMAIKSVNNVDCSRKEPKDVAKLFADAVGTVLILSEVPYPPARIVGGGGVAKGHKVYDNEARPPPYGLTDGGVWVRKKYVGETTQLYTVVGCLCCVMPGVYSIMNPVDERDVYVFDGKAYTADGECIGVATPAD